MKKINWNKIQKKELDYHLQKNKDQIPLFKIPYWQSFLKKTAPFVTIAENTRVLEVGCGCCGILMALEKGILTGMDPLMDAYLENFEFLRTAKPTWSNCAVEQMEWSEEFDVIFTINSLDHMLNPQLALQKMDQCLRPGGHLIISLNCHRTDFFHHYYQRFYRYIDAYHPHHFRPSDIPPLLPKYTVLHEEDIDPLYLTQRSEYQKKVLQKKDFDGKKMLRHLFNPFKYPVALARLLAGFQNHRKQPSDKSIFATWLFVLQKPKA